ncbi:uncharacterized protein LOC126384250 [Epinephelus moara]|uniref:uncharacterized protein LOC126384250 n=1 Tax=Epinephelus moara TaxID=300413 RepID=UPI00214E7CCD|nr:uncharacterized protein LOC126384250 [Epinephelus moara]
MSIELTLLSSRLTYQSKMKTLFVLLLFCHIASAGKTPFEHSLKFFFTGSYGIPNFPEFVGVVMVNHTEVIYCDSNIKRAEPKQDWMKKIIDDDPKHLDFYTDECRVGQWFFSSTIESLMQRLKQTGGVHTLQNMFGCEWNDDTEEVKGFNQFGYDGEDFMSLDLRRETWIPETQFSPFELDFNEDLMEIYQQTLNTKQEWDSDKAKIKNIMHLLTQRCPQWLRKYLSFGKSSLLRKELPSVSLLQKSPSSPLSCHATGFYPNSAMMFWRKDGNEYTKLGEILPNHDGSFQMRVDLYFPSVTPVDWNRFDCVFHLSGVKDDIVTRLSKAVIRTNGGKTVKLVSLIKKPNESLLILIICLLSSPVEHSLKFFSTESHGVPNFPEFVGVVMVDDTEVIYCDSNLEKAEPKQDWIKKIIDNDPKHLDWYTDECRAGRRFLSSTIESLMQRFQQTGGIHTLQNMFGCEWNDDTEEVKGFNQFGYDGEDFMSLDLRRETWIPEQQVANIKKEWDNDKARMTNIKYHLTQRCPQWLKKYLDYGKSPRLRTDRPSVSLLQKSPSSPVSCHATGFYPNRAMMFWRKDGEEIHENVDHGEILPNHDGSFQMSSDLNISSVPPEDWGKYECVFQLSGVKEDIVTKLDKAVIRTNWGFPTGLVIGVVVGLLLLLSLFIIGLFIWRRNSNGFQPANRDSED